MRLGFPWALILFLPILKMIFDHVRGRHTAAVTFSSLAVARTLPRTHRQRLLPLPFWLQVLSLCFLIIALAHPQRRELSQGVPREGVAIELVVDVSSSMDISMPFQDSTLSRMEITRGVIEQFVGGGDGLGGRPNDLIGLVCFARYADTICPLTLSHDSLRYFIQNLKIESRPNEDGTAFGDAMALAAARLRTAEERYRAEGDQPADYSIQSKVMILLTDGNNNCGRHLPLEAAALAEQWGVRVHTIAITDPPETKTIQTPQGPVEIEADPLAQERILRKIAETTGGIYRRAVDESSLRDIYQEIDVMETSELETHPNVSYANIFQPFAIASLLCLVGQIGLGTTWLRKIP